MKNTVKSLSQQLLTLPEGSEDIDSVTSASRRCNGNAGHFFQLYEPVKEAVSDGGTAGLGGPSAGRQLAGENVT